MPFNINKHQLLQMGNRNNKFHYNMKGQQLKCTLLVKDLGVLVSDNLNFSKQCSETGNKTNRMLGYIKKKLNIEE